MLKIINPEGRVLQLAGDQVLPVERNNPLFNDADTLFTDISYSGEAALTTSNKLFIKMGHLVESGVNAFTIPVTITAEGINMLKGNMVYRVVKDENQRQIIQFHIEPNLTSLNNLLRNIRLPEIITEDPNYSMFLNADEFEPYMLDTVMNPDKYPHIYFPLYNPAWVEDYTPISGGGHTGFARKPYINYYDVPTQQFIARNSESIEVTAQSPYFKVSYILKQIAAYLGFNASGSFAFDDDTKNLCIYTRFADSETIILPCMMYMPNILIADAIKALRDRLHLAFDFDLRTAEATIETFKTIKKKAAIDLSKYISPSQEQEAPDQKGYTVTLKSDTQDENFQVTDAQGNETYPPLFTLVAGDGNTVKEIDCATTKPIDFTDAPNKGEIVLTTAKQTVFNTSAYHPGGLPPDMSYTDASDPTTLNNWPLRLIKYLGYLPGPTGHYPRSEPYNLNDDDADFYRFLNDSKRLIITCYMPAHVIGALKMTDKYGHRTTGGNFVTYILEKVAYDISAKAGLIPVKMYVRTLNYQEQTKVDITPFAPLIANDETEYAVARVKAYFDPDIHGIDELQIEVRGSDGSVIPMDPIKVPTNYKGTGGAAVPIIMSVDSLINLSEFRIYRGQPKYIIYRGQRVNFTKASNYYTVNVATSWGATGTLISNFTIFF